MSRGAYCHNFKASNYLCSSSEEPHDEIALLIIRVECEESQRNHQNDQRHLYYYLRVVAHEHGSRDRPQSHNTGIDYGAQQTKLRISETQFRLYLYTCCKLGYKKKFLVVLTNLPAGIIP